MSETSVKLPAELFALAESSRFEGVFELPVLSAGPDDYAFSEPLRWEVDITNTGSAFLVSGTVAGAATCPCARCLEDVPHAFEGQVEGYFLIDGAQDADGADEEEEAGADEFDVLPADHVIDLAPLLVAALIVDAPEKPLCSDDCAGLCPQCGANLNEGPCGCGADDSLAAFAREANPFSALADYRFET